MDDKKREEVSNQLLSDTHSRHGSPSWREVYEVRRVSIYLTGCHAQVFVAQYRHLEIPSWVVRSPNGTVRGAGLLLKTV